MLADVAAEVVSNRLLTRLREELGASYSPFATFDITPAADRGDDFVELYIEVGTAPAQVDVVAATMTAEIAAMLLPGPTDAEIEAAFAVVMEQFGFVSNDTLADVLIASRSGVGETTDEYLRRWELASTLSLQSVRDYLSATIHPEQYIEIRAIPR